METLLSSERVVMDELPLALEHKHKVGRVEGRSEGKKRGEERGKGRGWMEECTRGGEGR
jgi:hypothetical protein